MNEIDDLRKALAHNCNEMTLYKVEYISISKIIDLLVLTLNVDAIILLRKDKHGVKN